MQMRLESLEDRMLLTSYTAGTAAELVGDINAANSSVGTNTITLTADITLTGVDNNTNGANGLPVVAAGDNLTIAGQGFTIARYQYGTPTFRLFDVAGGASLSLQEVTVSGGYSYGSGTAAEGGAVYNAGNLALGGVTLLTNLAWGVRGSGVFTGPGNGDPGGNGMGGGVYVAGGAVTITDSTFSYNGALGGSGGFGGSPHGMGGTGGNALGGSVYVAGGNVALTGNTFSFDHANGGAGGAGGNGAGGTGGTGGNGGDASGAGVYVAGGTVNLTNNTFAFLYATGGTGGSGGAGATRNATHQGHGGSGGNGGGGFGAGMFVASGTATVTLLNDTLGGNSNQNGGNRAYGGSGGNGGNGSTGGEGGNGCNGQGAGLFVASGNTTTLINTLIAGNTANAGLAGGGGNGSQQNGTAGSAGTSSAPDVWGTVASGDYDLIGNTDGASGFTDSSGAPINGNLLNVDPVLGPFGNFNGGPTETLALSPGSPAIDAGDSSAPGLPGTDQRGYARIVGNSVDIGADEYNAVPATVDLSVTASAPAAVAPGGQITYTLTVTNNDPNVTASDITLTDRLPANTTVVSWAAPGGWSSSAPAAGSGTASAWIASLAPDTSATFTLVVQVNSNAGGLDVRNTASVGPLTGDPSPANNSAISDTRVYGPGGLVLTPPAATEGAGTGTYTVATFTDSNPAAAATEYTATVTWGDGGSGAASVVATGTPGSFAVLAGHTYAEEGTETLSVQVSDASGNSVTGSLPFSVADAPLSLIAVNAPPGSLTEGQSTGTFTVAVFSDANTNAPLSDFTAVVNWGDGTSSTITSANGLSGSGGSFVVQASHTFAEEITAATVLSVQVFDVGGASAGGSSSTFTVADAPLTLTSVYAPPGGLISGRTGTFTVATFTDGNAGAPLSGSTAVIAWGDGTTTTVTGANGLSGSGGNFAVQAAHNYTQEGIHALSVQVLDAGGASTSATGSTFTVAPVPAIKDLYSTYLGGSSYENGNAVAVDASGDVFVTGQTYSTDFPTAGAHASAANSNGNGNAFVTEFSPTGAVLYSTALGGSGVTDQYGFTYGDYGTAIAVDASGDVFVTGQVYSTDFPTAGANASAANGHGQAFVAELDPTGKLLYSTALGGTGYDYGSGIAVDASWDVLVTGYTQSTDFPTAGAHATAANGNGQAFVTELDPTTGKLLYSTALGGTGYDQANGIAVDGSGDAFVTGTTYSTDFPTAGANASAPNGNGQAFVTELDPTGKLLYSTALAGSGGRDSGNGIAVDGSGDAFVTGRTQSTDFPTAGAHATAANGYGQAFVTELDNSGALLYSTALGGSGSYYDYGSGIAVDASGDAYVTGSNSSTDFPTAGAHATAANGQAQAFVAELDNSGALRFSTALGGSYYDYGSGIAVDASGDAFVAGTTGSTDFPTTPGAFQSALSGGYDAFVTELAAPLPVPSVTQLSSSTAVEGSPAFTLTVSGSNFANDAVVRWNGTALSTTYVSNTSLQALVPAAQLEEGTASITVSDQAGTSPAVPFTVTDAALSSLTISNLAPTEGVGTGNVKVATFHDAKFRAPLADFTATIAWGDGSTTTVAGSSGGVVALGLGNFALVSSHTYAEEGTCSLSVQVLDAGGSSVSNSATVAVADAALVNLGVAQPLPREGTALATYTVATFHDNNLSAPVSDFTATVAWGDGGTTTVSGSGGGIVSLGKGNFAVLAGYTYAEEGNYTLSVQVSDAGGASISNSRTISVADAPLARLSLSLNATEGLGTTTVATFSDLNAGAPVSDFTATIAWGDGSTTTVSGSGGGIVALGGGNFAVLASHTYAEEGNESVAVQILDDGGSSLSASRGIRVADAPLSNLTLVNPGATEGIGTGAVTVATFSDTNAGAAAADFTATVRWGDGSAPSAATVVALGGGSFAVLASHTYAEERTSTLSVQVLDDGGASLSGSRANAVADAPLGSPSLVNPGATEGLGTGAVTVATFSDANTAATAADFTAVIAWGDGSSSTVTGGGIVALGGGSFAVLGSHTYAEDGTYTLSVQVLDDGGASASASGTIAVADAPLSAPTIVSPGATEDLSTGNVEVATFHDANLRAPVSDFTALIDWGDGSSSTVTGPGIVALGRGNFAVMASHTYAEEGTDTLSVQVLDAGGSSASTSATVAVADAPLSSLGLSHPLPTEGVGLATFTVATFHDNNRGAPVTEFTATVSWGDGGTTTVSGAGGGIVSLGKGNFAVLASYTYAEEGNYTLSVQVSDAGGASISNSRTISVADAALSSLSLKNPNAKGGQDTGTYTLATFHDANLAAPAADFTAAVYWGDGTSTTVSASGVVALGGGNFAVLADHTWAAQGTYTLAVAVADVGGASVAGTLKITVAQP
jgi:uncharacterized repeat protein (TIGR01451 family)